MISDHLQDPEKLEKLYRENKRGFLQEFSNLPPARESELIRFWKIRLAYESVSGKSFHVGDLLRVMMVVLVTAVLVKLPAIIPSLDEDFYMMRNLPAIAFNGLIVFFMLRQKFSSGLIIGYSAIMAILLVWLNLLPSPETDSVMIALIHSPLLIWCLLGVAYISGRFSDYGAKMEFIRYNGELITMTGLLLITGGIFSGINIGLFAAIGINIEDSYGMNIALPGAIVSPVIGAYLISLYPDLTRRIIPVIARLFAPIVLVTLVIYMVSLGFSEMQILEDRNLLVIFNAMVVAVVAIIIFSVTELDKTKDRNIHVLLLMLLAIVTLIINSVALTAIITRLTYGITPNRIVVVSTNILVFVNLILIAKDLYRAWIHAEKLVSVEKTVANYLTVYFFWTIFAIFFIPLLFRFL